MFDFISVTPSVSRLFGTKLDISGSDATSNTRFSRFSGLYRGLFFFHRMHLKADTYTEDGHSKGKVLVGGGTGFVGQEVCALLGRKGYQVVVISRSPGAGITWTDVEKTGLPSGTVAVVNVAGHNILDKFKRWNDNFKKIVYESRILPSAILKNAIENCPPKDCPKCFVQITGAGFYPFDEVCP